MRYSYTILYCIINLFILSCPINALSEDNAEKKTGNIPEPIENTLTMILNATSPKASIPSLEALDTLIQFISSNIQSKQKIQPKTREYGKGVFYTDTIKLPFSTLIEYVLNPDIPGEAIYPTSIRRNTWINRNELTTKNKMFFTTPLPPKKIVFARGVEYEEITPDISSGCYYNYLLNRLFILYNYNGNMVLFTVAFMPETSSVGLRGAVVDKDNQWLYVYTPTIGTNITMLTWAKTYMYGSATISIYVQQPQRNDTTLYMFKWTKAGWSSMNVVTHKHIIDGISRFIDGFKQVIESPNRPSIEGIIKKNTELNALSLPELQQKLIPFTEQITAQSSKKSELSSKIFNDVLKNEMYPTTLTKENAIAELLKLYVKSQITQAK